MEKLPKHFKKLQEEFGPVMDGLKNMGEVAAKAGPLEDKTIHLIQLAASATLRSEGAVHSHVRRALSAGASPQELRHAMIVLIPTIGFPTVSAALSWINDMIDD